RFWDRENKDGKHTRLVSGYALDLKVMHGIVPVYEDGSAHFVVVPNKNLYFQALDENFMEIQRMRTYVNLLPGEQRSCIGCHEYRQLAPANKRNLALANEPSEPGPQPGDRFAARTIHYQTDVQPIFDSHCVKCHSGEKPKGKLNLSGEMTGLFSVSYDNILSKKLVTTYRDASDEAIPAKTIGSHKSKLITKIRSGHKGVKLSQEEFIRLVTWVDASAQYYGSYYGRRNIKYKDHPNFRPTHSFEQAVRTTAPLAMNKR
ncbi:MAG: HzsA-related protein, partial [Planctomycetota bacterium]